MFLSINVSSIQYIEIFMKYYYNIKLDNINEYDKC